MLQFKFRQTANARALKVCVARARRLRAHRPALWWRSEAAASTLVLRAAAGLAFAPHSVWFS